MIAVFGVTVIISKPGRSFPHWLASMIRSLIQEPPSGFIGRLHAPLLTDIMTGRLLRLAVIPPSHH